MSILISGGAGYIGSHTVIELLEAGYEVVIADNLYNSSNEAISRIKEIANKDFKFYETDLTDLSKTEKIFEENKDITAIIHFAAYKAVGESVEKPLEYYDNNLTCTLNLFKCMKKYGVTDFVFSSSATVYGDPHTVPITEEFPLSTTNPYGATKLMIEDMLRDISKATPEQNIAILRYFNPIGAHKSGKIGEDPNGIPNNLVPYIAQVAVGKLKELRVFGDDYNTPDGTGVRDYIHVVDLAKGHVSALKKLEQKPGLVTYNLGTGNGYSVLEVVAAYEKACGKKIAYAIAPRRAGDIAQCFANPDKAKNELGWEAQFGIDEMCADSFRWQTNNPNGYKS